MYFQSTWYSKHCRTKCIYYKIIILTRIPSESNLPPLMKYLAATKTQVSYSQYKIDDCEHLSRD